MHGVPRSILLGRAWPGPGEPLFLPEDTDGAVALALEEQMLGPCGQPHDESMRSDMEDRYATRLVACHACAAHSKRQQDLAEDSADHGLFVHVDRIDPPGGGPP